MHAFLPLLLPLLLLLLQGTSARPILRGVDKTLTLEIENNETKTTITPLPLPPLPDAAAAAAIAETPAGAAAAAAAEAQITEGEHCKVHFKWVVSQTQRVSSDGSMGVIMLLDHAGSESDEATTPAFREWVAGQTYEDELEFAHCPDAKIHGFRVVFYPYQVPGSGPAGEDDPSSLSFSHVEAQEMNPLLHEDWAWTEGEREEGGEGGGGGKKKGPFVVAMERYTTAWILKG